MLSLTGQYPASIAAFTPTNASSRFPPANLRYVSGFNVGAKGTVSYIEPTGRMWVMRDGASTDVFYTPDEVVRIEQ